MRKLIAIGWFAASILMLGVTLHSQRAAQRETQALADRIDHLLEISGHEDAEVFPPPASSTIAYKTLNHSTKPALASVASACLALGVLLRLMSQKRKKEPTNT